MEMKRGSVKHMGNGMGNVIREKKTGGWKIRLVQVLVVLLAFAGVGVYIYAQDYYRASVTALEAIEAENLVDGDLVYGRADATKGVIIYPGGKVDEKAYAYLAKSISDLGYETVVLKMPLKLAILGGNRAKKHIQSREGIEEWVIIGHSLGGVAAAGFIEKNPEKIGGMVFMGSYPTEGTYLGDNGISIYSFVGTEDRIVNQEALLASIDTLGEFGQLVEIPGGNHSYYANYGNQENDGSASIGYAEQQQYILDAVSEILSD
jgi:predicted esterase